MSEKKPKRNSVRLHGKRPSRPRGRHAVPQSSPEPKPEAAPVPVNQRLGFRIGEWAALTGGSPVTVWRRIKDGSIPTVGHGPTKLIPRSYAVRTGYISE